MTSYDELADRLRTIEEELRDLAFDRLRAAAAGDEEGKADEKRLNTARRAVEKAIRTLAPVGAYEDD